MGVGISGGLSEAGAVTMLSDEAKGFSVCSVIFSRKLRR